MYQTGYLGAAPFATGLPFNGGFCKWYFTPRENLNGFPAINPVNQWLISDISLKDDKTWFGPIDVPDDQLGFEEISARSAAGPYYKQKVYGSFPGDNSSSRPNMENLPWFEFVCVGKQRAGGLWVVFGTDKLGLQLDADFNGGQGGIGTAAHAFAFTINSTYKGLILPEFLGSATPPSSGNGSTTGNMANQTEIIFFTDVSEKSFDWTPTRLSKFGVYPEIEVWYNNDAGGADIAWTPITVDVPAPDQTMFTIYNGDNRSGFIVLK